MSRDAMWMDAAHWSCSGEGKRQCPECIQKRRLQLTEGFDHQYSWDRHDDVLQSYVQQNAASGFQESIGSKTNGLTGTVSTKMFKRSSNGRSDEAQTGLLTTSSEFMTQIKEDMDHNKFSLTPFISCGVR
ncbi:hypothetical protein T265_08590 [Opisthorchis viverrini]|uniref:Uncharacterized protein n=1 Tax=Opisthorchis viverrini TaxID=6198 RepID=A0A075A7V2_OPIVI|nr:hypothetical protein T265_08590 [Opisthorchis viverrini]KER23549.1 hypothetical protein T265_08590 [Opisthorchis viverrini]